MRFSSRMCQNGMAPTDTDAILPSGSGGGLFNINSVIDSSTRTNVQPISINKAIAKTGKGGGTATASNIISGPLDEAVLPAGVLPADVAESKKGSSLRALADAHDAYMAKLMKHLTGRRLLVA